MRMRKKKWSAGELFINKRVISEPSVQKGNWHSFFGNNNPIHIELGCGKGQFINQLAQTRETNYIAIEKYVDIISMAARLGRTSNSNAWFIVGDVKNITEYFGEDEIDCVYINFCDPWHKTKHASRRLTHANFLSLYRKILKPNGIIKFKTDNLPLFEFSLRQFKTHSWYVQNISYDLHASGVINTTTEYEDKFSNMGMPIYYCEVVNRI